MGPLCFNILYAALTEYRPSNENCFFDIKNFTMTQVKYLNVPNGS